MNRIKFYNIICNTHLLNTNIFYINLYKKFKLMDNFYLNIFFLFDIEMIFYILYRFHIYNLINQKHHKIDYVLNDDNHEIQINLLKLLIEFINCKLNITKIF